MKKISSIIIILSIGILIGMAVHSFQKTEILNPFVSKPLIKEDSLKQYSFKNLKQKRFDSSQIIIDKVLQESPNFNSYLFYYSLDGKKISGLLNLPVHPGVYPVAIMLRGYVDKEIYTSGVGTQRVGETLAENGFITLAPDFLGYGKSDKASINGLEERFQTYTATLTLLNSIRNLESALIKKGLIGISVDDNNIALWGHSNGGHIALSTLAITGKNYPTSLWAPVSKHFPYSILYYTDEYSDQGKYLRKIIAEFEQNYDISKYSPPNYYSWIKAPIQIHQGISDDAVPLKWSDDLYHNLTGSEKEVDYYTYENADHNLLPSGWNTAVSRTIEFYNQHIK